MNKPHLESIRIVAKSKSPNRDSALRELASTINKEDVQNLDTYTIIRVFRSLKHKNKKKAFLKLLDSKPNLKQLLTLQMVEK